MVRFSHLVVEQPRIREIDIKPVLASSKGIIALDARIVLHEPEISDDQLPRLAIRPYPVKYAQPGIMKDGDPVIVRPIRPEDEPLLIRLHQALSERTVYLRYFQPLKLSQRTAHERLTRICFIDYDREMALVAERQGANGPEVMGVTRLSKLHGTDWAESAVVILDECQHLGLGTELVRRSIDVARAEKVKKVITNILPENFDMRALCKKLGFEMHADVEEGIVRGELDL